MDTEMTERIRKNWPILGGTVALCLVVAAATISPLVLVHLLIVLTGVVAGIITATLHHSRARRF